MPRLNLATKYGYLWVTLAFFLLSFAGHWIFAWKAYVVEQEAHARPPDRKQFLVEAARDSLENWQSEFLQLMWQVAGLALLLHIGSPQSKEGDERREEKLDYILRKLDPKEADKILKGLEKKYPKG